MRNVSLGKKRWQHAAAAALVLVGVLSGPGTTFASTVLPSQVLPPATGKACAPVTFSDIQAHVYNNSLDSFDINVSDSSYVAVSTTVDNAPVAFNYISRWKNADGSIKMHVDLQPIRMSRDVPVQITFLSAHSDQTSNTVTCIFNVPAKIPATTKSPIGSHVPGGQTQGHISHPNPQPTGGTSNATSSATSTRNPAIVGAMSSLGNLCADGGATRLWVVLLILFALFCFTLCAQKFEIGTSVRDWNIGLILAVFVGLLIFWYVSATCRTGSWAPAFATIITIVALLYTMLKGDDTTEILLLKDGKK